jgi:succinate dehydrogenase/fumarate reductase cytochrome b subunit
MKYLKAFALWLLHGILGVLLLAFFVVMMAEWAAGCGETYVDSKGKTHQNECIFIKQ